VELAVFFCVTGTFSEQTDGELIDLSGNLRRRMGLRIPKCSHLLDGESHYFSMARFPWRAGEGWNREQTRTDSLTAAAA
jgi:hypothetical protein